MALSPAQSAALKADIAGNAATVLYGGTPTAISAVPNDSDGNAAIAAWYSAEASPAYKVWDTAASLKAIRAATDLSKYTPSDAVPASTGNTQGTNDALLYANRAFLAQLKQANAVFLISGEGIADCTSQQFRQSFSDCMTAVPTGASGANQNAGWGTAAAPGAVRLAMQRNARNAEKLFSVQGAGAGAAGNVAADPRGGTTNPDALVHVGGVSGSDVETARNLP